MKVLPILALSALLLAGCGGGSSSSSSGSDNSGNPVNLPEDGNDSGTNPGDDNNTGGGGDEGNTDPDPGPGDTFAEQMLYAVNQARAEDQVCGGQAMPAVPALEWNLDLQDAADRHSGDMANMQKMSHTGSDGSSVSTRVTDEGYEWSTVAENVAAGQTSIEQVMSGWMASSGHCTNIMNAKITEMGASVVESDRNYWTQVFAKPK
ncbi:CAP domain-containing protein [Photobacterium sp. DNB22_13_2]